MAFLNLNTDIKPWLGIPVLTTIHDDVLTIINNATNQAVLNYVETDFALHTQVNEVLDANQSDVIIPKNIPIVSIQKIYLETATDGSGGSLLDPTYYQLVSDTIVLQGIRTPFNRSRVRVDYTWGYNGLPADVKLCMLQTVEAEFRRKGNKTLGLGGRSKKDESETFKSDLGDWDDKTGLPKVLIYKLTPYKCFEFPNQPMAVRNV